MKDLTNMFSFRGYDFGGLASRHRSLKWVIGGVIAILLGAYYLYRLSIPDEARRYYIVAKELYDAGKYSNALYAVNEALRDRSQRLNAYRLRAEIYRATLQPNTAVSDITRVIGMQPNIPENYAFRARLYSDLDDAASAARDYTKVIELNNSPDGYTERGRCYLKLNETQKAINDFTKAIDLEARADFYLQRGLALSSLGDHRAAILDFDRGIEVQSVPSMLLWYCYRARAAEKQTLGDSAGAAQDRQKAASMQTVLGYADVR